MANFGLPPERGDFGSGAVEVMGSGAVFVALLEHPPAEAATALFVGHHRALAARPPTTSRPTACSGPTRARAACSASSSPRGRPFCLYVVIGSHRQRAVLVREANRALAAVAIG